LFSEPIVSLHEESCQQYDFIIEIANGLTESLAEYYTQQGGKIVTIQYGNNLLIEMGEMIYKPDMLPRGIRTRTEIWTSPHYEFAIPAYKTLEQIDIKICPYIWESELLKAQCIAKKYDPYFNLERDTKNVSVLESNLYIVKTCKIPILVAENLNQRRPDLLNNVFVYGSHELKENKTFEQMVRKLTTFAEQKISFEHRYSFPWLAHKDMLGVMISHQWNNELNYLQLEAMHLGAPFVHNSPVFAEYGYYYPDFDVEQGGRALEMAMETHKDNFEFIKKREAEGLWNYDPKNPKNIKGYVELIEEFAAKHIK